MTFEITTTQNNKGSRVLTAIMLAFILVGGGVSYRFWTDRDALHRHLKDRDTFAVLSVWVMLKQGVEVKARQPLLDALEHGQPTLRAAAATALGTLRDQDLVADLGKAVRTDASPSVRMAAVEALEVTGSTLAAPYVRLAIDDVDFGVQQAACLAVGGLRLREYVDLVIEKLGSPDPKTRKRAREGLERFLDHAENSPGSEPGNWAAYFRTKR